MDTHVRQRISSLENQAARDPSYDPARVAASCRDAALSVRIEAHQLVERFVGAGDTDNAVAYLGSALQLKQEADCWQAVLDHFATAEPLP